MSRSVGSFDAVRGLVGSGGSIVAGMTTWATPTVVQVVVDSRLGMMLNQQAPPAPVIDGPRWLEPWAVGPGCGLLTEAQEDFVDYWTPELMLAECRSRRELICALDEWALTAESEGDQRLVDYLFSLMIATVRTAD